MAGQIITRDRVIVAIVLFLVAQYPTGAAVIITGLLLGLARFAMLLGSRLNAADTPAATSPPAAGQPTPIADQTAAAVEHAASSGGTPLLVAVVLAVGVLITVLVGYRKMQRRQHRLATPAMRAEVFNRWGDKCAYRWVVPHRCRGGIQMGHQESWANGGVTHPSNLQPECGEINRKKSGRNNWPFVLAEGYPLIGWAIYAVIWLRCDWIPNRTRSWKVTT